MDSPLQPLLVTTREAARILSVSERQLYNLRLAGRLHVVDVSTNGGRPALRYRWSDLEAFVNDNERAAGPETGGHDHLPPPQSEQDGRAVANLMEV